MSTKFSLMKIILVGTIVFFLFVMVILIVEPLEMRSSSNEIKPNKTATEEFKTKGEEMRITQLAEHLTKVADPNLGPDGKRFYQTSLPRMAYWVTMDAEGRVVTPNLTPIPIDTSSLPEEGKATDGLIDGAKPFNPSMWHIEKVSWKYTYEDGSDIIAYIGYQKKTTKDWLVILWTTSNHQFNYYPLPSTYSDIKKVEIVDYSGMLIKLKIDKDDYIWFNVNTCTYTSTPPSNGDPGMLAITPEPPAPATSLPPYP